METSVPFRTLSQYSHLALTATASTYFGKKSRKIFYIWRYETGNRKAIFVQMFCGYIRC